MNVTNASSEFDVITGTARAAALMDPLRLRILNELREPDSAAGLARRLKLPRQKLNYHLRELEKQRLVELVQKRRRGNCTERVLRASARFYVLSPEVLGPAAADLWTIADRFSSSYLLATAANVIRELGELQARASAAKKRLATLTLQTDIRFASAAQRSAFTQELTQAIAALTAKYHDEKSPSGRRFKLVAAAYPATNEQPSKPKRTEDS